VISFFTILIKKCNLLFLDHYWDNQISFGDNWSFPWGLWWLFCPDP